MHFDSYLTANSAIAKIKLEDLKGRKSSVESQTTDETLKVINLIFTI